MKKIRQNFILVISFLSILILIVCGVMIFRISSSKKHLSLAAGCNHEQIVSTGNPMLGGDFEMTTQHGKSIDQSILKGKYSLLYFGYRFCPDICPTELDMMAQVFDMVPLEMKSQLQPIFVTIDPERDTNEVLLDYLDNFGNQFIGLTGSVSDVKRIAKAWRVYYNRVENEDFPDGYMMDHSSLVYFLDSQGSYLTHFSQGEDPSKVKDRIMCYLSQSKN